MEIFKLVGKIALDGTSQVTKGLKGVRSAVNSSQAGFIALGAAAGVAGAAGALLKAAEAAGVQEAAEIKLAQALKNAGNFTEESFQKNLEYARSLQQITKFGDETILSAQSLIAAFGFEGEELEGLTKATLDLAEAKGMDLKSAADLVGKSVGSSTNALTRYGIEINGAVGSTERANTAIENISKLFGGAAQAQAETFQGRIAQLKNRWGDLVEEIGKQVIPVLTILIDTFNDQILPVLEGFAGDLNDSQSAASFLVNTLKVVISVGQGVIAVFDLAGQGIASFALAITGNLKAAKLGFQELGDKIQEQAQKFREISAIQIEKNTEIEANKREQQTLTTDNKIQNDQKEIESDLLKTEAKVENDTTIADSQTELENSVTNSQNRLASNFTDSIRGVEGAWERFGSNIVDNVLKNLIKETLKAIGVTKVLKGLLGGATGGGLGFVGSILGFEKGVSNFVVPSGFPNDSFPIGVTSGETVNVTPAGKSPGMTSQVNIAVTVPPVTSRQSALQYGEVVGNAILSKVEQNRKISR